VTESPTSWPDTTDTEPPHGDPHRSAVWLLGRHPQLAQLATRVPGAVIRTPDGPHLALDLLGGALMLLDLYRCAWILYEFQNPAPTEEHAYAAWAASAPDAPDVARDIGPLSDEQMSTLRLLGTFSRHPMPFGAGDIRHLDRRLLADWYRALDASN
jgi:hypothetical protein